MYTVTENSVSYKQKYDLETQVEKQNLSTTKLGLFLLAPGSEFSPSNETRNTGNLLKNKYIF